MIKKITFLAILVLALPLAAMAHSGIVGSVIKTLTAMPETNILGLLGTGLIGFATLVRRKLKFRTVAA
jgi:hypothetical protein